MSKRLNILADRSILKRVLSFYAAMSIPFTVVASSISSAMAETSSKTNYSTNLEDEMISPEFVKLININRTEGIESITQRELSIALNTMTGIKTTSERTVGYKFVYNEPIIKSDFTDYSGYFENPSDAERVDRINQLIANLYEDYRVNGRGNKQYNLLENKDYKELYNIIVNETWRFEIGGRTCLKYVHLGNLIEFFRLYFEHDLFDYVSIYYDGNKIKLECKWEKIRELKVKDPSCPTYEESVLGVYEHLVDIYMNCLDELITYMNEHPCEERIVYGNNSVYLFNDKDNSVFVIGGNEDTDSPKTM